MGAAASGEKVSVFDAPPENVKITHRSYSSSLVSAQLKFFSLSLSLFLFLSVVRNPGRFSAPDAKRRKLKWSFGTYVWFLNLGVVTT